MSAELPSPVARVVLVPLADGRRAKVIRAVDERLGQKDVWIVRAPEGTLLYDADTLSAAVAAEQEQTLAAYTKGRHDERERAAIHMRKHADAVEAAAIERCAKLLELSDEEIRALIASMPDWACVQRPQWEAVDFILRNRAAAIRGTTK